MPLQLVARWRTAPGRSAPGKGLPRRDPYPSGALLWQAAWTQL